jgi:hypothetical protein
MRRGRWLTMVITYRGEDRTITWRAGKLSGDPVLISAFLDGAEAVPGTIDPWPYSSGAGWRADPLVAQWIMLQIGPCVHQASNIRWPRWVKGRVY